jgi:hypothetical protein
MEEQASPRYYLKESLLMVAKHGVPKVFGVTRSTSPAAKFVYRKFGGTSESYQSPWRGAASTLAES